MATIDQAQQHLPLPSIQNQTLSHLNTHSSTYVFDDTIVIGQQIGPDSHSDNTDIGDDTVIGL